MTITNVLEQAKLLIDLMDAGAPSAPRRLSELRGLGKEIWQDIEAQDYVDQMRDEWDTPA